MSTLWEHHQYSDLPEYWAVAHRPYCSDALCEWCNASAECAARSILESL